MRRIAFGLIGFLAIAAVIGYAVTSGGPFGDDSETMPSSGGEAGAVGGGMTGATVFPEQAAPELATDEATRDGAVGTVAELGALPEIGPSVIKTAQISIKLEKDEFGEAFDAASLVAARYGGFVQSSSASGTEVRSGELVIRVPAERFDEAMSDLRDLGEVEGQSMSGEDVSAQFVDLEARLRAWQAQEAVLLDLMSQATSIEATIRVQSELQDVQVRIEQIKGELRLLEDRTSYATIQVSMREPGGPVATVDDESTRPSLAEAWERALDGLLGVFYVIVVGLGYLVPISVIGAVGWFAYRRLARPRPTPAS
jgi:hypothetical protein